MSTLNNTLHVNIHQFYINLISFFPFDVLRTYHWYVASCFFHVCRSTKQISSGQPGEPVRSIAAYTLSLCFGQTYMEATQMRNPRRRRCSGVCTVRCPIICIFYFRKIVIFGHPVRNYDAALESSRDFSY